MSWAATGAALTMRIRYTPAHPLAAEDDHAFIVEHGALLSTTDSAFYTTCGSRPNDLLKVLGSGVIATLPGYKILPPSQH